MGNADSNPSARDIQNRPRDAQSTSRERPWRRWFLIGTLLTVIAMAAATMIRLNNGVGRVLGVDVNAVGDSVWAVLTDLSDIGPLGTAMAAVVAAIALSQKWRADDRTAWWSRVQWAADHSLSKDDDTQLIGMSAMASIRADGSPSEMDRKLMDAIGQRSKREEMDDADPEKNNGDHTKMSGKPVEGGDDGVLRKTEEEDPGTG